MNVYLTKLALNNYRNFSQLELNFNNNIIIILGDNGTGKTNMLESISLLSPGRGFRGAKYDDIACHNNEHGWLVNYYLQSKVGSAHIKSEFDKKNNSRTIEYNGSKIANSELPGLLNVIWLTPQMEGIFLAPAADRRKFLDRIVYNFYPE